MIFFIPNEPFVYVACCIYAIRPIGSGAEAAKPTRVGCTLQRNSQ